MYLKQPTPSERVGTVRLLSILIIFSFHSVYISLSIIDCLDTIDKIFFVNTYVYNYTVYIYAYNVRPQKSYFTDDESFNVLKLLGLLTTTCWSSQFVFPHNEAKIPCQDPSSVKYYFCDLITMEKERTKMTGILRLKWSMWTYMYICGH